MRIIKGMLAIALALVLAACGSGGCDAGSSPLTGSTTCGGSTSGGGGVTTTSASISVSLSSTTVTSASPATVTATVVDSAGKAASGVVVTFSTSGGLGTFNSTTALTNSSGRALVTLFPAASTTSGADQVVASANVNGATLSSSQGFQLTSTSVTISGFTSDVGAAQLSAYGQSNLTVSLAGAAPGASVSISLSSVCVAKGKATITPSTASTTSGIASFTYRDAGCGATDSADAVQATVTGATASASLNIFLSSPAVSSITFASATPSTIYLKGSGFSESSQVVFEVKDLAGNVLPNQDVTLEPTTLTGGLTIDGGSLPVTKKSDSSGRVSVIVNSGTVPTPVRVRATLTGSAINTVSSSLAIAVGLPSQLNFSLSQGTINIEGFNVDGTSNTYTIIASDRLGNPVPDGTAINFVTEGGQVQAIGQTTGNPARGGVTVQFQSSSPRPDDGRITIVAYALGEESFLDTNGNNVFDAGEAFQDLGNLYLNRAYDGAYTPANDQFISLSISGNSACNTASLAADPLGLLTTNKTIPTIAATCDGVWSKAYVRRATETVLSTSGARPLWGTFSPTGLDAGCSIISLKNDFLVTQNFYLAGAGTRYGMPASGTVSFINADRNLLRLNPMPAGTTVTATGSKGLSVTVLGGSPVPSTASASSASLGYEFDATTTSGVITVRITSPGGLTTVVGFALSQAAPPSSCPL